MQTPDVPCQDDVPFSVNNRKSDLTLFWNSHGPVLERCQERRVTINSARHSDMACGKLKSATLRECRVRLSNVFLHDNACLYAAIQTLQTLQHLHFEVIGIPVGLQFIWAPQKCFKFLSFCRLSWTVGGAYVAHNIFLNCIKELCHAGPNVLKTYV